MLQLHHIILLLTIVVYSNGKENDVGNELSLDTPPVKLDPKLRKALLKALTELENEEKIKDLQSSQEEQLTETTTSPSVTEFDSFDTSPPDETTTDAKQIVIIQKSSGIEQKPIIHYILPKTNALDPINETILTSASSSFASQDSKELRSINNPNKNSINDEPSKKKLEKEVVAETTTLKPTTSTEESEAKVEDVQFFSAPLVAAFTVHQDERGVPKSVVPIYKSNNNQVPTTQQQQQQYQQQQRELQAQQQQQKLKQEELQRQSTLQEKQKLLEQQLLKLQEQTKQQETLLLKQQQLFQEQQFKLQLQNNQQLRSNELQHIQLGNKELQNNNKPFVPLINTAQNSNNLAQPPNHLSNFNNIQQTTVRSENQFNSNTNLIQKAISRPVNPISFNVEHPNLINNNPTSFSNQILPHHNFKSQQQTRQQQHGSVVSFQPSVSFTPSQPLDQQRLQIQQQSLIAPINQQLPIKNPVDFHRNPYYTPPTLHQLLTLTPPGQNNQNQNLRQGNRIFRQEVGTGNFFGNNFNNNNNQVFVQQQQVQQLQQNRPQSNRFFRSNVPDSFNTNPFGLQPPVINQQLNNLLYQSGISRGRPNDDLNIVSKILSYNVGGNDNFFGASNNVEKKVPSAKRTQR